MALLISAHFRPQLPSVSLFWCGVCFCPPGCCWARHGLDQRAWSGHHDFLPRLDCRGKTRHAPKKNPCSGMGLRATLYPFLWTRGHVSFYSFAAKLFSPRALVQTLWQCILMYTIDFCCKFRVFCNTATSCAMPKIPPRILLGPLK